MMRKDLGTAVALHQEVIYRLKYKVIPPARPATGGIKCEESETRHLHCVFRLVMLLDLDVRLVRLLEDACFRDLRLSEHGPPHDCHSVHIAQESIAAFLPGSARPQSHVEE